MIQTKEGGLSLDQNEPKQLQPTEMTAWQHQPIYTKFFFAVTELQCETKPDPIDRIQCNRAGLIKTFR